MQTIKIQTTIPLKPQHTRQWRGAMIEQILDQKKVFDAASLSTQIFHNHDETKWNNLACKGRYDKLNDYPMVQYISENGKATLLGIREGAKALQIWSGISESFISVKGKEHPLEIERLNHEHYAFSYTEKPQQYLLKDWIPFNAKKIKAWQATDALYEKAKRMDKALFGHFMHAAEQWQVNVNKSKLLLHVHTIRSEQKVNCFNHQKTAFDIVITTNASLPVGFGLGQGASIGFGRIQKLD
jgi:hypothetical protein